MKKSWSNTALVAYSLLPKIANELNFAVESRIKSSFQSKHLKIGISNEQLIGEILDLTEEKRKIVNLRFIVNKALELIRLKACEGLTPADAATLFGASRRSAELRFKAATGQTIGDAILAIRLKAACEYLANGTSSVAAIANFCGWKSDLAFRKAFKSRFGISPRQWKSNTEQTDKQPRRDATPAAPPPEGTPRVRGVPSRDQPNL